MLVRSTSLFLYQQASASTHQGRWHVPSLSSSLCFRGRVVMFYQCRSLTSVVRRGVVSLFGVRVVQKLNPGLRLPPAGNGVRPWPDKGRRLSAAATCTGICSGATGFSETVTYRLCTHSDNEPSHCPVSGALCISSTPCSCKRNALYPHSAASPD